MHRLIAEAENRDEVLFVCDSCPRRFMVGKRTPKMVEIDKGDYVEHIGSLDGATFVRITTLE